MKPETPHRHLSGDLREVIKFGVRRRVGRFVASVALGEGCDNAPYPRAGKTRLTIGFRNGQKYPCFCLSKERKGWFRSGSNTAVPAVGVVAVPANTRSLDNNDGCLSDSSSGRDAALAHREHCPCPGLGAALFAAASAASTSRQRKLMVHPGKNFSPAPRGKSSGPGLIGWT
jgi:hypothetical protein